MAELEGVEKCQPFVFSLPDLGNRELDKIRAEAHGAFTSKVRALMVFAAGSPPGFRLSLLLCVAVSSAEGVPAPEQGQLGARSRFGVQGQG